MSSEIKLYDLNRIQQNLYNLVDERSQEVTNYVIDVEPIDTSSTKDDIVMKERTYRDVRETISGVDLNIIIDVDYAILRNETNYLHPETKHFIEKGLTNAVDVYEKLDYNRVLQ